MGAPHAKAYRACHAHCTKVQHHGHKGKIMKKLFVPLMNLSVVALLLSGCALGVTPVKVRHSPLQHVENKREGTILVRQFVDNRQSKHDHRYIGTKRNGFGMPLGKIGIQDGAKLEVLVTDYFAEALREVGYQVVIQPPSGSGAFTAVTPDAILEGEIKEFWLDLYMAVWHNVDVLVKLRDKEGQNVLWEKAVHGDQTNMLWLGLAAEFEMVIRQALDKALNQAINDFASEEFHCKLKSS